MIPSCHQCKWGGNECYKKTHGPGCLRCMEWKIKCSTVEEQRRKKEMEGEKEKTVKVKRLRKVEGLENGEGEKIGVLKRIVEALEGIMACLKSILVKNLALVGAAKRSETSGRGYLSFLVMALSCQKSTYNWRELSFFLTKRTGAPNGELEG